jgi:predicted membrane-bound spermidine synthase
MGGIGLAFLFKNYHKQIPRLYMSDLLGAGLGVLLAIWLMNSMGTPTATFYISVPVLLAAFLNSRGWMKLLPVIITIVLVVLSIKAEGLLTAERKERAPVVYTHWDAMAKIKLYEPTEEYQQMNIDNVAHTGTLKFDGNWERPDSLKFQFALNLEKLIEQFDSCHYLIIGAGGGVDVIQPLQAEVPEIHAVEVIPHINYLLTKGQLAEFSGNIYHDPRVKVATEDARSYVRRFTNKFDIIYSSSSNTFAALASGAFALAENYLFTVEAFQDYWNALSDSGFMVVEHQVYIPRVVSEVMEALEREEVIDRSSHLVVYNWPRARRNVMVLSKQPLTDQLREHAIIGRDSLHQSPFYPLYPPADSVQNNLVHQIVVNGWQNAQDSAKIDISPATDNRPFVAQLGLLRHFDKSKLEKVIPYSDFYGFPLSKIIIIIIIMIIIILIIPINLLPYLIQGKKLRIIPWFYFFTIGMAFMMVEIIMIQKYTLFIGASLYSTATILLTLLIASGVGSAYSGKFKNFYAFGGIIIWLLLEILLFPKIVGLLTGLSVFLRIFTSAILIFPLGFFMGIPFPKGGLKVGELIDWGFAVNGAASVLGSAIIVLVAFSWGFDFALFIGLILYGVAYLLIAKETAW